MVLVKAELDRINAVKTRIRTNLVAQGVTVPSDTTLDEMATQILSVAGYTPQKGVDFWTPADQESIVQDVITALKTPVFGRVDTDNNIILTGQLAEGAYTLKYEDAEGNVVEIGTIDIGGSVTNILPLAVNSDKTLYNGGKGYKEGYRLNSSGTETAQTGMYVTGFMPIKWGDDMYLSGMTLKPNDSSTGRYIYVNLYTSEFASVGRITGNNSAWPAASDSMEMDANGNVKRIRINSTNFVNVTNTNVGYVRLSAQYIDDKSIATANEPIE